MKCQVCQHPTQCALATRVLLTEKLAGELIDETRAAARDFRETRVIFAKEVTRLIEAFAKQRPGKRDRASPNRSRSAKAGVVVTGLTARRVGVSAIDGGQ